MKIFGREPALFAKLVGVAIMVISLFVTHWSPDVQGVVNAAVLAVVGLVVAWKVSYEKALAGLTGVAGALISLGAAFGLHLSADQQVGIMSAISIAVAFWLRGQVTAPVDIWGTEVPSDAHVDSGLDHA